MILYSFYLQIKYYQYFLNVMINAYTYGVKKLGEMLYLL